MSRAAHDAVRSHLDLGGEEVSAGAAAQLVRECKTDRQAAAALAAAHDGVVRAGFSAADASRAGVRMLRFPARVADAIACGPGACGASGCRSFRDLLRVWEAVEDAALKQSNSTNSAYVPAN